MDQCSIGKALQQTCDEESYTSKYKNLLTHGRMKFEDLDLEQQFCLTQRTGSISIIDICQHHHTKYVHGYPTWQKNCCNPLNDT